MRFSCITVGYRTLTDDAVPEILAGPEVAYAEQEAALDAAARADDGGDYVRMEIWHRTSPLVSVDFSTAAEKAQRAAALDAAAAQAATAELDKANQREALLKQAEALGFDPAAAAKAQAEADAARAEAEAAKAELEALKTAMTRTEQAVKLPETSSQETPVVGGEVHTLVLEGSTPSPATNSTPTETAAAEGTPDAPEPPAAAPAPAPVTARRRP